MRAVVLALATAALSGEALAQIPRTADGRPDLQGVWSANIATPLQRSDDVKTLVVTPDKAKELVAAFNKNTETVYDPDFDSPLGKVDKLLEIDGQLRSSLLIDPADGQLPLTALGKAALARRSELRKTGFDNPEERPSGERCVDGIGDPPISTFMDLIPSQIVQTPTGIVVAIEDTHGGRIITLVGETPPDAVRSRVGYSAGRWESDTLVVVTDHFTADDPVGASFHDDAMVSRASRVTEWFSLAAPDLLLYRYTIEDPALYDRPWMAEVMLRRSKDRLYEYACHEGNRGLTNILQAARLGRQTPPAMDKPSPAGNAVQTVRPVQPAQPK